MKPKVPKTLDSNNNQSWWIPITFTSEKKPFFRHTRATTWFRKNDKELTVTGLPPRHNWVLFNLQQTGIYLYYH